jgi:hypothetical protein
MSQILGPKLGQHHGIGDKIVDHVGIGKPGMGVESLAWSRKEIFENNLSSP